MMFSGTPSRASSSAWRRCRGAKRPLDAQASAPQGDDHLAPPPAVPIVRGMAHHGDDLVDRGRVRGVADALVAWRTSGVIAGAWSPASGAGPLRRGRTAWLSRTSSDPTAGTAGALHGQRRPRYRFPRATERLHKFTSVPRHDRASSRAGFRRGVGRRHRYEERRSAGAGSVGGVLAGSLAAMNLQRDSGQ
jgi:hypothetical protein